MDASIRSNITVKIGDAEATKLGSTSIPLSVKSGEKVVYTYTPDSDVARALGQGQYVLELAAKTAARHGVKPGAQLSFETEPAP